MTCEKLNSLEDLNELKLTEAEEACMLGIFDKMAENEKVMEGFNTDSVEVMVHVMPINNVFRADCHKQLFSRESLLDGSPEHTEDSWQVPRLVK